MSSGCPARVTAPSQTWLRRGTAAVGHAGWALFRFAGQIADDVELGPGRQAIPELSLRLLAGAAMELGLADVLDRPISPGRLISLESTGRALPWPPSTG